MKIVTPTTNDIAIVTAAVRAGHGDIAAIADIIARSADTMEGISAPLIEGANQMALNAKLAGAGISQAEISYSGEDRVSAPLPATQSTEKDTPQIG